MHFFFVVFPPLKLHSTDAVETAESVVADALAQERECPSGGLAALLEHVKARGVQVVDVQGWKRIDEHERAKADAKGLGQPRVKLATWEQLLAVAQSEPSVS